MLPVERDNCLHTMRIHSKAPCRVDLAGGTIDIWPICLYHDGAVTVNFAVDRYTTCTLQTRQDSKIILRSKDMGGEESFESISDLAAAGGKYKLPLAAWQLRYFRPTMGLEIETHSEAPVGAGISGSSALIITINAALNK